MSFLSNAHEATDYIQKQCNHFKPTLGIVLGSGLGALAEEIEEATVIQYENIPNFNGCTVKGHSGTLYLGHLKGVPVACLQGRPHYYEGASNADVQLPMRTLKLLGCDTVLSTNASGSLREHVQPGSLVVINDHINFQFNNSLVGPNNDAFGTRFVGMEDTYDAGLRRALLEVAADEKIELHEGIYMGVLGPAFETPAEIRMYRMMGGEVIGMSTIPEVIAARHCGLKVGVIAVISNMAAGMTDIKLSHEETLRGALLGRDKLIQLVSAFLEKGVNA